MLKEKIISKVDKSWDKDLIIRYLYVALAPGFQRDIKFFSANEEAQYNMLHNGITSDCTNIMCLTICQYYQTLYNSFDIDCEIIKTNNYKVPHYALIVYSDNKKFFIDPLKDLEYNQYRCQTKYFGTLPISRTQDNLDLYPHLTILSENYLIEMDEYLGLVRNGVYTNDIIDEMQKSIFNNNDLDSLLRLIGETKESVGLTNINEYLIDDNIVKAKLELINRYLINIGLVNGPMERYLIYQYLKVLLFNAIEAKKIRISNSVSGEIILTFQSSSGMQIYKEEKDNKGIYSLNRKR